MQVETINLQIKVSLQKLEPLFWWSCKTIWIYRKNIKFAHLEDQTYLFRIVCKLA